MRRFVGYGKYLLSGAVALAALASLGTAHAGLKVLYPFAGGRRGAYPEAGVIEDSAGNLYGTTEDNGTGKYGTVFKLAPDGTMKVLHAFGGGKRGDGAFPYAGLIEDSQGNLYGTTGSGGIHGSGTVFKLAPDGTETVLYSFAGDGDGAGPDGGVILDKEGNLYGTTFTTYGGRGCEFGVDCGGTVFKLAPDGTYTVLHSFTGEQNGDGADPLAGLTEDRHGNLYGTTTKGGGTGCTPEHEPAHGCGTVFKVAPDGTETVLYAFRGHNHGDGSWPAAGVIRDAAGNLFGTTDDGGAYKYGTAFKLAPDGTETVLHSFAGGSDGAYPEAGLIEDKAGNLYGTTYQGGANDCYLGQGCGTVFRLAPDGAETILYVFRTRNRAFATNPSAGLIEDKAGNFYGTTEQGGYGCNGYGCGTVFRLKK